jgi:pimeloyl-ACP methyl ester carboxylesterase
MKADIGLTMACAAILASGPVIAQSAREARPVASGPREQTLSIHNPYTSGAFSAHFLTPARTRPFAAVALISGVNRREQLAAASLARFMVQRGFAVMILPTVPAAGPTENDNLNVVASLHYLQTRQDLRGAPVGLIGYGDGVRLASVAASEGNPAAFLALLGGAVVPDNLNSVPETLSRAVLPKDEAARALQHVRCPVLVLLGEYDRQGTHRTAAENSEALRTVLDAGHHDNYTITVLTDTDSLLADAGAGGSALSTTAIPPASVWKTAADWMGREARTLDTTGSSDVVETEPSKPIHLYPKSVYGDFRFHPWYVWQPAIGDQPRPYGFWYW